MKCKSVYKHICENLDADINSPKCRAIKKHLASCPDCSAYLDSLKKTILLYKHEPGPRLPLSAHRRLVKLIDIAALEAQTQTRKAKGTARSSR
jgi:predicted anti-sigma-YlaC factor YlaD